MLPYVENGSDRYIFKSAIKQHGSVTVAVYLENGKMNVTGTGITDYGTYVDKTGRNYYSNIDRNDSSLVPNHAVLIVGWDDNGYFYVSYDYASFTKRADVQYAVYDVAPNTEKLTNITKEEKTHQ